MNSIDTYRDISITSEVIGAAPAQQITLLFEKLNQDIATASEALQIKDIVVKCKKLSNAQDILLYFIDLLDFNADPEMANRLLGIYNHLQNLLFWANARNDLDKLNEAKTVAQNLNDWWNHVNS